MQIYTIASLKKKKKQYEENSKGSFLYSIAMLGHMGSGDGSFLTGEDYIYLEEQSVIQTLAQNGPAVFMGHCAAKALENQEGVLKVFIHANEAEKKRRIEEDYEITKVQAENRRIFSGSSPLLMGSCSHKIRQYPFLTDAGGDDIL